MPILGKKAVFLGLGAQVKAPLPYFFGGFTQKKCVAWYWSQIMGVSGPPHPKNGHFLPQKGVKMPKLGLKHCFLGFGGQFKAPPPYFAGAGLKETSVAWYGSRKIGISGPPHPIKRPFFRQKWPKIANLGQKSSVFGHGCSVQDPPTLFFRCLTRYIISCMVLKPENRCFRVAPPKKWAFFAQKGP